MRRTAAIFLILLAVGPARAAERGPVCREASVVDEITLDVRARDYYADVDPRLVTEQPTSDRRVVRCLVCVLSAPYDTVRFGGHPVARCEPQGFEVQILTGGFVVRALP